MHVFMRVPLRHLRFVGGRRFLTAAIALVCCVATSYVVNVGGWAGGVTTVMAQQRGELSGTARLSGAVTASQPFKAAQVFIRNVDKNVLYMVFTNAGQYRSLALFPGNYEVQVKTKGLESAVQKLALRAGENAKLSLTLQPGAGVVPSISCAQSR